MRARSWVAALAAGTVGMAGIALGAGAVSSASAQTPSNGPGQEVSAGDLYLSTISLPTTVTYSLAPTGTTPESVTVAKGTKCRLATSNSSNPAAAYLSFSSSTGTGVDSAPGYSIGSQNAANIGVQSGKENGAACSQVDDVAQESLTVQLATDDPGPLSTLFGAARAESASFDVNLSGNAIIDADLYRGTQRVGGAELQSGFSAVQQLHNPTDQLYVCSTASNSGPQSVYNNNCYWDVQKLVYGGGAVSNVTVPTGVSVGNGVDPSISYPTGTTPPAGSLDWDRVVLTARVGSFSVQGGGQWPSAVQSSRRTHFVLKSVSDGTLLCGQSTAVESTTVSGNVTSAQVTRVSNGNATPTCKYIDYTLGTGDGSATFHKPLVAYDGTPQPTAQFGVTLTHVVAPTVNAIAGDSSTPLVVPNSATPITVNWEDPNNTTDTLTFCPAGLYQGSDSSGNPKFDYSKVPGDLVPADTTVQYACIYGENKVIQGDGSVATTDQVYLTGDAKFAY